jgi:hypothetical protein
MFQPASALTDGALTPPTFPFQVWLSEISWRVPLAASLAPPAWANDAANVCGER